MTPSNPTPRSPAEFTAWSISVDTADDVVAAITAAVVYGYRVQVSANLNNGVPAFAVTLIPVSGTVVGYPNVTAQNGWWFVWDGAQMRSYTDDEYIATYTDNIPVVWAATTTPPAAAALAGAQAQISCPAPTSANAPWDFTLTLTDTTANTVTNITDQPTVENDQLVWTATGLTVGDEYTAQIICDTQYEGVSATSLSTAAITAE